MDTLVTSDMKYSEPRLIQADDTSIIIYHPDSNSFQNSINDVCWPDQLI
jgi:hypothetical protein